MKLKYIILSTTLLVLLCSGANANEETEIRAFRIQPRRSNSCLEPCLNGGTCAFGGRCRCTASYKGNRCQYPIDVCKIKFNGISNCKDSVVLATNNCTLQCEEGLSFSTPPAPAYVCLYENGTFSPSPIPQCVYKLDCEDGKIFSCNKSDAERVCPGSQLPNDTTIFDEDVYCGCHCPGNLVRDGDKCIPKNQCPCSNEGQTYEAGEKRIQDTYYTCTCVDGAWNCEVEISTCSAWGDPHFTNFGGKRFDFMGKCSYYLMKTSTYSIEGDHATWINGEIVTRPLTPDEIAYWPSATRSITVRFGNLVIVMDSKHVVTVNDEQITDFPYFIDGIVIWEESSTVFSVTLTNRTKVAFQSNNWMFQITTPTISPDHKGGICGTPNTTRNDNFTLSNNQTTQDPTVFGNSWITKEFCQSSNTTPTHPCDNSPNLKSSAELYCSKIKSYVFKDCQSVVDPQEYYEACLYDMCACTNKVSMCLCPSVAIYAQACSQKNINVDWRSQMRNCGIKCNGGQVYQVCGNSCTRSCSSLAASEVCEPECVEGCNCPPGEALDENKQCVKIEECKCSYADTLFNPGDKVIMGENKKKELCTCHNAKWQCVPTNEDPGTNSTKCTIKDMVYTTCLPLTVPTCSNMDTVDDGEVLDSGICRRGCICKKGLVLNEKTNKCVKPQNCPCTSGGKSYPTNAVVQRDCNSCTCGTNGTWRCTKRVCLRECSMWGLSHYKTFDRSYFDVQGQCDYTLSKGTRAKISYDITIENVECGIDESACLNSVRIKLKNIDTEEMITLTKENPLPRKKLVLATVSRNSNGFTVVQSSIVGITVLWDQTTLYVRLTTAWKNKVVGLCGNYNGNDQDDKKMPNGEEAANIGEFVDSWKLQEYCPLQPGPSDPCARNSEKKQRVERQCSVLTSDLFLATHTKLPVQDFYKRCVHDGCACDESRDDRDCVCTALAAYAQEANNVGVPTAWRTRTRCPLQCNGKCTAYNPCVALCPNDICNSSSNDLCDMNTCLEGCQPLLCPSGLVYSNSSRLNCVSKNNCKK